MTREELVLIATFMELPIEYHKDTDEYGVNGEPLTCMNYDTDWNVLMTVIEKIRAMDREVLLEADLYVGIPTNRVVIRNFREPHLNDRQVCYCRGEGSLIGMAFKAIVEFIEHHNKL